MGRVRRRSRIPLEEARSILARVWLTGAGLIFALLVVQSILGRYSGKLQEVWAWFVPTVVPAVSLMLGVLGASSLSRTPDRRSVRAAFFGLCRSLSVFYLLILALTVLAFPFSPWEDPVQLYTLSNYWLGPLQGVALAALGVLFNAPQKPETPPSQTPKPEAEE